MEAANRFGEDLEKLGLKYGVNSLAVYGERLVSHVNNFDIENMRSTLHTFPEIINRMKKEV